MVAEANASRKTAWIMPIKTEAFARLCIFNLCSLERMFGIDLDICGESTFDALYLKEDVMAVPGLNKEGPCRLSYLTSQRLRNKFEKGNSGLVCFLSHSHRGFQPGVALCPVIS